MSWTSDAHGWSLFYIWWGGSPTNFEFCPTNFPCDHAKFREILKRFGFRMAGIFNIYNFEGFPGVTMPNFGQSMLGRTIYER